jgi:hypothetical protein
VWRYLAMQKLEIFEKLLPIQTAIQ